ncbi:MAG: methyltransferase family protein [Terriglobales bacterium]
MNRNHLPLTILLLTFLLLLFLGWGLAAWRDYFASPARAGLILAVLVSAGMVLLFRLDLQALRRGRLPVGSQPVVLRALALASLGLIWFLPFADRRQIFTFKDPGMLRYVGLLLCSAGIALRLLALAKLGRQFSAYVTLQEGHQLVQSGIYRMIRHPLYLSLLLAAPGMALVFDSTLVWPILGIAAMFVATRIRHEEKLLKSEFGRSFDAYQSRSWRLLPLIF